jgi:hypothetical protein
LLDEASILPRLAEVVAASLVSEAELILIRKLYWFGFSVSIVISLKINGFVFGETLRIAVRTLLHYYRLMHQYA